MEAALPQPSRVSPHQASSAPGFWRLNLGLTKRFWTFFAVAFFFDAGFAVYFFLFNLFLLDIHATERTIGLINGAFTLGSTLTILPAGALGRRWGIKPLLLVCMAGAPVLGALRVLYLQPAAQIILGFFAGAAMSLWAVAYLPAVARLTTEKNRASAYSLIFSASILTSAIGGAITGYLPRWLNQKDSAAAMFSLHRSILLSACAIAALAIWPSSQLIFGAGADVDKNAVSPLAGFRPTPFLGRFLPSMALWTAAMGAFLPFANVYLAREHRMPLDHVALIFSASQCLQLFLGLLTPAILRIFGLLPGILVIQLAAATCMAALALSRFDLLTVGMYLLFSALQWMAAPALYNLLMSNTADAQRSHAAAMAMFLNTLLTSVTVTAAGAAFTHFGYRNPLLLLALSGTIAAATTFIVVRPHVRLELQ